MDFDVSPQKTSIQIDFIEMCRCDKTNIWKKCKSTNTYEQKISTLMSTF